VESTPSAPHRERPDNRAARLPGGVCKAAEWATREARQIHGGDRYAQEHSVSRLYSGVRLLSVFQGADETLCLKVIARRLCDTSNA
jgi:(2S)-methylsuccinyl-CoA dehydrogenase